MNRHYIDYMQSPIGLMQFEATQHGLTAIRFVEAESGPVHSNELVKQAIEQMTEYFAGIRKQFNLALAAQGTAFQQAVWSALTQVKYGQTASYSDIAKAVESPKAVRAVGAANGKNPLSIVVPCHRVIGKNGTLTGYAGGLSRKQMLLALEEQFA